MKVARATIGALAFTVAFFGISTAKAQMMRLDSIPLAKIERGNEPFGRAVNTAPAGPLWIKWRGVDNSLTKDDEAIEQCRVSAADCSPATTRLIALIDEAKGLTGRRKLATINRAINLSIAYTSDEAQFGKADEWSGAITTFASGRGDCEDYAIAKMFALRAAGVPAQDLRMLVARARNGDLHAVLAARDDGHWLLLDNRTMMLVEDTYASDLSPIVAFMPDTARPAITAPVIAVAAVPEIKPVTLVAQAFGDLNATPYWF